jgi:hypothetical protein
MHIPPSTEKNGHNVSGFVTSPRNTFSMGGAADEEFKRRRPLTGILREASRETIVLPKCPSLPVTRYVVIL